MKTNVCISPYEISPIFENVYVLTSDKMIEISSVDKYEDSLVRIKLPDGEPVIVKASHLITAVQKCVL